MDISRCSAVENVTVREDFSAAALVAGFFLPFGKIFQKIQTGCNAFDMFLR